MHGREGSTLTIRLTWGIGLAQSTNFEVKKWVRLGIDVGEVGQY